ncbi:MAG: ABC transporter substrate-binding protein [Candidatus Gastranaerophilales bacterium]|nr:ABC transporter substrate-binding protein [Candidatus Gastranaerophilales bacterium]
MKMKKMIKKVMAAGIALTFLCGVLTGCGVQPESIGQTQVRIGALKGPTTIGLLNLADQAKQGACQNAYEIQMATAADELLPLMVKGELDIALIPANVASVLYNNTEGQISVIDINTLGVLYVVSGDDSIVSVADLEDKTVYLTGKGTTPDYVIQYILEQNNVNNCALEYKSEATEVAAVLAEDVNAVGLLPQPFVTVACRQNDALSVVLDLNEEWERLQGAEGSSLVTGVTVVRNAFLEEHPEAVKIFLEEHAKSAGAAVEDIEKTAELAVEAQIVAQADIAKEAIPQCNIVCITGDTMRQALSGYLEVLYERNPASVGGTLPGEGFYYLP